MIVVEHLAKHFGKITAVADISFTVQAGEIFGLVGPDGAGKTTLLRMLTGVMAASAGKITIRGYSDLEAIKSYLGYVSQQFSLYTDLTVMENMRLIGTLYGTKHKIIEQLVPQMLAFTNLLPFKDYLVGQLSGGMKQKLALATALLHKPEIFLLDEPTTGVDPVSRREFWQLLYQLNKEGATVVVSTPYMDEAQLCHQVAFVHNGRIVCCASPQELQQTYPYIVWELYTMAKNIKSLLTNSQIIDVNAFGNKYHLVTTVGTSLAAVATSLKDAGIPVKDLQPILPSLEDVFVYLVAKETS